MHNCDVVFRGLGHRGMNSFVVCCLWAGAQKYVKQLFCMDLWEEV